MFETQRPLALNALHQLVVGVLEVGADFGHRVKYNLSDQIVPKQRIAEIADPSPLERKFNWRGLLLQKKGGITASEMQETAGDQWEIIDGDSRGSGGHRGSDTGVTSN